MNLKVKAALQTVGFFALVIVASLVVTEVMSVVSAEQLKVAGIAAVAAFFAYMVYSLLLSQLEYRERIKQIANKE